MDKSLYSVEEVGAWSLFVSMVGYNCLDQLSRAVVGYLRLNGKLVLVGFDVGGQTIEWYVRDGVFSINGLIDEDLGIDRRLTKRLRKVVKLSKTK